MLNKLKNSKILVSTATNIFTIVVLLLLNFNIIDVDTTNKINQLFGMILTLLVSTLIQIGILTDNTKDDL